jgi:hypothetical protein
MELLEVLYSPGTAFAKLRGKKWAWILPTLLSLILSILTIFLLTSKYSVVEIMETEMIRNGQEIPPQGVGAMVGVITVMMYVAPLVISVIALFLTALVLLAIVKGFSGNTSYPAMMNVSAFAGFAYGIFVTILFLIMLVTSTDLQSFNVNNPVPLNAAYFVTPEDVGKPMVALLSGFNLMNFYLIYMLALGASKLSERVTPGKVIGPLIAIYAVYILGKAGIAALS